MMMDILMYLFETYVHSDADLQVDQDELEDELLRAGFKQKDIYKALEWLEDLAELQNTDNHSAIAMSAATSTRIYTAARNDAHGCEKSWTVDVPRTDWCT